MNKYLLVFLSTLLTFFLQLSPLRALEPEYIGLSNDGDGIRSLVSATILTALEEKINSKSDSQRKLSEMFDYGGTSARAPCESMLKMFREICDCELVTNFFSGLFFSRTGKDFINNEMSVSTSLVHAEFSSPQEMEKGMKQKILIDINPIKTKGELLDLCLYSERSRIKLLFVGLDDKWIDNYNEYIQTRDDKEGEIRQYFSNHNSIKTLRSYTIEHFKDFYRLESVLRAKEKNIIELGSPYHVINPW